VKSDPLTSPKTYAALGALMAADAVFYAIPLPFVTEGLDKVNFPREHRWIFPPIKAAAAIGLFSVTRIPALARLTTAMLTLYFMLAVGSHIRSRDLGGSAAAATTFLATFAAMTAKGPRDSGPG
jgi:DoxX-like family